MATFQNVFNELLTHYQLVVIEAVLVLVAVLIALIAPGPAANWFRRAERHFTRFARQRLLAIVFVGGLVLVGRVALLPLVPVPVPGAHDEFAYLLAADTFALGRVTNPTHPMWMHFESFHILQNPTYNSMYPVAASLMMAVGKVLFGHPWWGVWLSAAIFCAALCWMLQGWLPPQWALLGGLIAAIRIGLFSFWINSYMGGAMAGIGGALVMGALPRLMRRPRAREAVAMGIGIAILANSRPSEGFFTAAGAIVVLLVWMIRHRPPLVDVLTGLVLPLASVLLLMCLAMGFYFWRVTGSPVRMPYQVQRSTYATAPVFLFQKPGPEPHYNHAVMRDFYLNWEQALYEKTMTPKGALIRTLGKFVTLWLFYFGPALTLPLFMIYRVLRDKRLRPLWLAGAVASIGFLAPAWFNAHYAAPMAGLLYVAVLQGMRHLRHWRWQNRPTGLVLAGSIPLICLLMVPVRLLAGPLHISLDTSWRLTWSHAAPGLYDRAAILRQLEALPGQHLVVVRYQPDHDFHSEWVYNEPNIDQAKVVWAREMDPQHNRDLTSYFQGRTVWLVEADGQPPRLFPYPVAVLTYPDQSRKVTNLTACSDPEGKELFEAL
jgi:hypothetical protein